MNNERGLVPLLVVVTIVIALLAAGGIGYVMTRPITGGRFSDLTPLETATSTLPSGSPAITVMAYNAKGPATIDISYTNLPPRTSALAICTDSGACTDWVESFKPTSGSGAYKMSATKAFGPNSAKGLALGTYKIVVIGSGFSDQIVGSALFSVSDGTSAVSGGTGAGMSKYTDADFGFSFWYPSNWQVTKGHTGSMSTSEMQVLICATPCNGSTPEIELLEHRADTGIGHQGERYYFDRQAHTWMYERSSPGAIPYVTAADVSLNTMGGLHMLIFRYDDTKQDIAIPLSARTFVEGTAAPTAKVDITPLLNTIVATDPAVATPVSAAAQQASIDAEARAYGVSTVSAPTSMKLYNDSSNRFSFKYPASLAVSSDAATWGGFASPSAEHLFSIKASPVALSLYISADPNDVGHCMVAANASTVSINGASWLKSSGGDAAMGHYTEQNVYDVIHNNACYRLVEQTDTYRVESNQERQDQDTAVAAGKAQIDPIVQSFTFGSKMNIAPPTCALTSKTLYKLGDVINLSWTSKNASRALWNQPADENTGIRKNIVPPAGTPDTNGTASTIANIEGYMPIELQVTGEGGFGSCSTYVSVSHSDAKPSITIDSIKFTGQGAKYTNNTYVDVTLYGTAINGGLYNNEVNIVLFDPTYPGPFDEASVYAADRSYFYSGGTQPGVREDSVLFKTWSAQTFIPRNKASVRVLAYYPFYSSPPSYYHSAGQPIVNEILPVTN